MKSVLEANTDIEVVDEAEDGIAAVRSVVKHRPDMVLLDLSMPKVDGISAIKDIKKQSPDTKILVLTIHKEEEFILTAFNAGADGYILKDAHFDELTWAIEKIMAGQRFISPDISDVVLEGFLDDRKTLKKKSSWDTLTQREREVLKMIAEGYKNADIAEFLFISVKTVEKHRSNLMRKLDLHNASELTAYAIKRGMVTK
ncbi:MAG: response regulator transcription factor [Desulfobacterales bacterium]